MKESSSSNNYNSSSDSSINTNNSGGIGGGCGNSRSYKFLPAVCLYDWITNRNNCNIVKLSNI